MKLNRKLLGIIAGCLVLLLLVCGCQHKEEEYVENITPQEEFMKEKEDLEILREEYTSMLEMLDYVLNMLGTEKDISVVEAIELLNYVKKNKITPTHELTIKLDEVSSELLETGLRYMIASESDKHKFEARIQELMLELENVCIQIENRLDMGEKLKTEFVNI